MEAQSRGQLDGLQNIPIVVVSALRALVRPDFLKDAAQVHGQVKTMALMMLSHSENCFP